MILQQINPTKTGYVPTDYNCGVFALSLLPKKPNNEFHLFCSAANITVRDKEYSRLLP